MAYSAEDKMRIAHKICESIAARNTITSSIVSNNIDVVTWWNWTNENQLIQDLFKKAKEKAYEQRTELLKEALFNQNERYVLEGKKTIDKVWKPSDALDENGVAKPKLVQMSERTEPCPPALLIFLSKNLLGYNDGESEGGNVMPAPPEPISYYTDPTPETEPDAEN